MDQNKNKINWKSIIALFIFLLGFYFWEKINNAIGILLWGCLGFIIFYVISLRKRGPVVAWKEFWKKHSDLKGLKYYSFKDIDKIKDKQVRINNWKELNIISIQVFFVLLFGGSILICLINLGKNPQLYVLSTFISILIFGLFLVFFLLFIFEFIFKFTTCSYFIYLLVPISIFCYIHIGLTELEDYLYFIIFVLVGVISYILYIYCLPLNVLRELNSKILLAGVLVPLAIAVLPQVFVHFFDNEMLKNDMMNFYEYKQLVDNLNVSEKLTKVLLQREFFNQIKSVLSFGIDSWLSAIISTEATAVSLVMLISNTIISHRIEKSKKKAQVIFRKNILQSSLVEYSVLKKISYLGGNEIENLLLSIEECRNIIITSEKDEEIIESPKWGDIIKKAVRDYILENFCFK